MWMCGVPAFAIISHSVAAVSIAASVLYKPPIFLIEVFSSGLLAMCRRRAWCSVTVLQSLGTQAPAHALHKYRQQINYLSFELSNM